MRPLSRLALLVILCVASVQAAAPVIRTGRPPATPALMSGLQRFLNTDMGAGLLSQNPSLSLLQRLSPQSQLHLQVVGAIELPAGFEKDLTAALESSDSKALASALAALSGAGAEAAMRGAVDEASDQIIGDVAAGKLEKDDLEAASSELEPFGLISEKVASVKEVAQAARSARTMSAAKKLAASLGRGKASDEGETVAGREKETPRDGEIAVAEGLIEDLHKAGDIDYSLEIVARLGKLAGPKSSEAVQRTVARGLVREVRKAGNPDYSLSVIETLQKIALKSRFDNVREIVVQGIMDDVSAAGNVDYSDEAMDAVQKIALETSSKRVKGLAIALLMRELKNNGNTEYSSGIQARIDKIGKSAGGLSKIPVPSVAEIAKKAETEAGSFWDQLSQGVKDHPYGAFFGLLALGSTIVTLGSASVAPLAIAAAGAVLLYMATKGLFRHHPVATFFQLALIGEFLEHLAKAHALVSSGGLLVAALGLGASAALAIWSFRQHRPVLGWFLNLALLWLFEAMILGAAVKPFFQVTVQ